MHLGLCGVKAKPGRTLQYSEKTDFAEWLSLNRKDVCNAAFNRGRAHGQREADSLFIPDLSRDGVPGAQDGRTCQEADPAAGSCGGYGPFPAEASNLYAGRIITLGTLLAIYLSTSDEMLPILISEQASAAMILKILAAKAVIGMTAGLAIDLLYRKGNESREKIHDICRQERCHCEKGILRSALSHTVKIALFILAVNLGLNLILHFLGEEALENLILNRPFIGPLLAGLVGLIPNCAGSVVITQLYLAGSMGLGAALAGLLAGSGVGLLVLFRVNHDRRENLKILALLYGIGVAAGIAVDWIGLA